jgi:hypothetical protein
MADDYELFMTKGISEPDDIIGQFNDVIGLDWFRLIATTVAPLVWDGDLEPSFHQRINLVAPQVPALRKAVQENDQGPLAFNHGAQSDTIRFDLLEIALFHFPVLLTW